MDERLLENSTADNKNADSYGTATENEGRPFDPPKKSFSYENISEIEGEASNASEGSNTSASNNASVSNNASESSNASVSNNTSVSSNASASNDAIVSEASNASESDGASLPSEKSGTDSGEGIAENRESPTEEKGKADTAEIDYERLANEDLIMLKEEFSELSEIKSIIELENPIRYGALRDLGLSPREAYLASSKPTQNKRDNRAHLEGSVPKGRSYPRGAISDSDMTMARELFEGISDAEIRKLYRKVTQ